MTLFLRVIALIGFIVLMPAISLAIDNSELLRRIESLSKELETLKEELGNVHKKEESTDAKLAKVEEQTTELKKPSWLEFSGDYRFRYDYLSGQTHDALLLTDNGMVASLGANVKNEALLTNRLGLNLTVKATENIKLKTRLLMYKAWGMGSGVALTGSDSYFADKAGIIDANSGHTPDSTAVRVDQVYATWSNILDEPLSFSVGRRPSTGGLPTNLRRNVENTAGVPGYLVDWAFDGMTVGYSPEIEELPGFSGKICFGKGFDSGFTTSSELKDTNILGVHLVPYDSGEVRLDALWLRAFNVFARAETLNNNTNLGDIDEYGLLVTSKNEDIGPGTLNLFAGGALSHTHPNSSTWQGYGLLWDVGSSKKNRTGWLFHAGGRYDLESSGTKFGIEYNHGSSNWVSLTPASDDMWTSKLGTRGNVYELYAIQEIRSTPISKFGKAFVRVGWQYYDFQYTGSSNWVGAPYEISQLTSQSMPAQLFAPVEYAHDIYITFDVMF